MTEKKDVFLILRLSSELKKELIKRSKRATSRSLSDYVRGILEEHVK